MPEKKRIKQIVAIVLPIFLFLGIVIAVAIPRGSLLKASGDETLLFGITSSGKEENKLINENETANFEITAKKKGVYEFQFDEEKIQLNFPNLDEEGILYFESMSDDFDESTIDTTSFPENEVSSSAETATSKIVEKKESTSEIYKVSNKNDQSKGHYFFKMNEGQTVSMSLKKTSEDSLSIVMNNYFDKDQYQTIIEFIKKSTEGQKSNTSDIKTTNPSQTSTEDSKKEIPPIEIKTPINKVETLVTEKGLNELTKEQYDAKDSLKKPMFINTKSLSDPTSVKKEESPIIVRDVKMTVKTGVAAFDSDDKPGHDSSETNNIVRSFDQVSYLASFSIQSTTNTKKYEDIRYRVVSTLDNAVEIEDGIPKNNGEIANGMYVDSTENDGSQYSEGVMESTISDTGQVFIPIIMNVYGAEHEKKLQPTVKIEIVDAKNIKTGEVESFNKVYDMTSFPALEVPETIVSASPSVGVQLVRGDTLKGTDIFESAETSSQAFDVGVKVSLHPLKGRATGDYRGSTFPKGPISFQIKQRGSYSLSDGTKKDLEHSQYDPFISKAVAVARNDRLTADWDKDGTVNIDQFKTPLSIPNGLTGKIYTSEPDGDRKTIGVFDSGKFSQSTDEYLTNITVEDYIGTLNPYTYNMTGGRSQAASDKIFSSGEFIFQWDRTKTQNLGVADDWTRYNVDLYVDSVSYDGITNDKNSSSLSYAYAVPPRTGQWNGLIVAKDNISEWEYTGAHTVISSYDDDTTQRIDSITGTAHVTRGANILIGNHSAESKNYLTFSQNNSIIAWNNRSFEFDDKRMPELLKEAEDVWNNNDLNENQKNSPMARPGTFELKYGIPKSETYNVPSFEKKYGNSGTEAQYTWYDSYEEALKYGKISAVKMVTDFGKDITPSAFEWYTNLLVPVKVIGDVGGKNQAGSSHVISATTEWKNSEGEVVASSVPNGDAVKQILPSSLTAVYTPAVFTETGEIQNSPSFVSSSGGYAYGSPHNFAESVFIEDFAITTKTEVEKALYQSTEEIGIKITGVMSGGNETSFSASLSTTLPKGVDYKLGSATYADGKEALDPVVTRNADGTSTLKWVFDEISDIGKGLEVNFKATSDVTQLTFKDSGYTDSIIVKTIGEMWDSENPSLKDTSAEKFRSSQDDFILMLIQQIILNKEVDKNFAEVGNIDPVGLDNSITYTIKVTNTSSQSLTNVNILDVLPYEGDTRGTKLSGDYTVKSISVNNSTANISYSNESIDEKKDPNDISGWENYTSSSNVKNAKGFLVHVPSLNIGKTVELTIKIEPTDQKAGDILVNNASMNSDLHLPVVSQMVWTKIFGRDLAGVAWYDDNLDGLIGNKAPGVSEDWAKDIPVKLYRTSLEDSSYKKELVKESLTGEKFVDDSGKSLKKTNENGKYLFENLPEGEYIAEFEVRDQVIARKIKVTKRLVGDDPKLNSKADQETYQTAKYTQPILQDLASLGTNDAKNHVTDVNIGLIRPATIRLFKYETGTAIDADKSGTLTNEEKATGKPLEGAVFDIYEGDEKTPLATETTNDKGILYFDKLFPGDYTLIETKAPNGYELIKEPIKVTITEGNQTIQLYKEDDKQTELPHAGGNYFIIIGLIVSSTILVLGLGAAMFHFRNPKQRGKL